jgi:transcriptional antiterminator
MAVSKADVIEARKGKPIRELLEDHHSRYSTLPQIAKDWDCSEITVRRLIEREQFALQIVPVPKNKRAEDQP